jgi:hypothetical protein
MELGIAPAEEGPKKRVAGKSDCFCHNYGVSQLLLSDESERAKKV